MSGAAGCPFREVLPGGHQKVATQAATAAAQPCPRTAIRQCSPAVRAVSTHPRAFGKGPSYRRHGRFAVPRPAAGASRSHPRASGARPEASSFLHAFHPDAGKCGDHRFRIPGNRGNPRVLGNKKGSRMLIDHPPGAEVRRIISSSLEFAAWFCLWRERTTAFAHSLSRRWNAGLIWTFVVRPSRTRLCQDSRRLILALSRYCGLQQLWAQTGPTRSRDMALRYRPCHGRP